MKRRSLISASILVVANTRKRRRAIGDDLPARRLRSHVKGLRPDPPCTRLSARHDLGEYHLSFERGTSGR